MQLKIQSILNFLSFYQSIQSQPLPLRAAYLLAQLDQVAEKESAIYFAKVRDIVREYGVLDENGELIPTEDGFGIKIRQESQTDCEVAVKELQSSYISVPDIRIKIDDFGDAHFTAVQVKALMPFLAE